MGFRVIENSAKQIGVRLVHSGRHNRDEIAEICDMSTRTLRRALAQDRNGEFVGNLPGAKRGPKELLLDKDIDLLMAYESHNPTLFLCQLADLLSRYRELDVSESTIYRALRKRGITRKKISKIASEQDPEKVAEYVARVGEYPAHYLVFLDEYSKDDRTYGRPYGRSKRGTRCRVYQPYVRKIRYTGIGAMALDEGMIASRVIEGSSDRDTFYQFLEEDVLPMMRPYPARNSVLVLDNARIHHSPEIVDLVESFGCRIEYLPPYSPQYNPIEQAWSVIKSYLRRIRWSWCEHLRDALECGAQTRKVIVDNDIGLRRATQLIEPTRREQLDVVNVVVHCWDTELFPIRRGKQVDVGCLFDLDGGQRCLQ